jgi:hypothetical protein
MVKRMGLSAFLGAVVIAVSFLGAACADTPVVGSGDLVTEQYDFANFTRVEVSHAFEVEITRGDGFSVEVTTDDNLVDRLRVEQRGDTVKIGMKAGVDFGTVTRRAAIVLPDLRGVDLSGASEAVVGGFDAGENLDLAASGASTIALSDVKAADTTVEMSGASEMTGDLVAADVTIEASGASEIRLQGSGRDADLEASGASELMLDSFEVATADVVLSGASKGSIKVSRTLDADLSGASTLTYSGNAVIREIKTSGASQVKRSE